MITAAQRRAGALLFWRLLGVVVWAWGAGGLEARGGPPGRADVAEVWGVWRDGVGSVAWKTASAWGTAGFRVFRLDPESGAEICLCESVVPVAFHAPAATYELADPAAVAGGSGSYRLEEVEVAGGVRDLGVHAVVFAPPPEESVRPVKPAARTSGAKAAGAGTSSVLKVLVGAEGLYGVSLADLATGMGLELAAVQGLAAADGLAITCQGAPVPLRYDAVRGRLVFFGRPATNWYAPAGAYLIRAGAGCPLPRRAPGATAGETRLPAQVRCEQDVFPFNAAEQRPADYYYWNAVISTTNPASNRVDFALGLPGYNDGALTLRVDVQGWTRTTRNPDHRAEYSLNGTLVGTNSFDDQYAATAVLAIPAGVASNGANTLTVRGVLTNASQYSYFVVDGVTAEYNRELAPGAGTVLVEPDGAAAVSAAAFTAPVALALDAAGQPTWIAEADGSLTGKAWTVAAGDARYAVAEADEIPLLAPVPAAADAWFLAETNRVDYLVVTSRALEPTAQALADYRAGQGLRTGVAVFEDLCDLLAGGLRTPEAIPALVRRAATTWAESPQMMVLAGDGHYDILDSMGFEANHLPPILRQTYDGLFSSDELLADAGGDDLPDVAVGRLPARDAADLAAMIAKIQAYEADNGAAWQNQLGFANDKADAAGNFAASVAVFTNLVQEPWVVSTRIDLDTTAITPARAALFSAFDAGAGMVSYSGHGTSTKLATQGLLTTTDIGTLTNSRTPVVVALCCLAGYFDAPAVNCVAEALLQRPQGGAVTVFASSAMPLNSPATDLGAKIYQTMLQEQAGPLGRATLLARRALPGNMFTWPTFATYNLLGDPALRLAGNDPTNAEPVPAQVFLQDLEQVCDGACRTVTATTLPAGLTVRFTYDGQVAAPIQAGTYAVTATVATAFHQGTATGTLVVAPGPATVNLDGLAQTYDGMPKSAWATTVPAGLAVALTYNGLPGAPVAAGAYEVVATLVDPNWYGAATGTLVVAKAAAGVVLDGLAQIYDGTPRSANATTAPTGLTITVTYNGSPTAPVNAGNYAVTAAVDEVNYEGGATGTLVVAKAAATVTLQNLFQAYDGTPRMATATTDPGGLAVNFTYDGSGQAPVVPGTYAVTGTVNDVNWEGVAAGTLVVVKGSQTIDFPPLADQWATNVVRLAATASSGLPVSFAVESGPGVIVEETNLWFLGTGTVSIVATQAGSAYWEAADPVVRSCQVAYNKPTPELSAQALLVREAGEGRLHVRLRSSGNLTISVTRVAGSTNLTVKSGATLTFRPWNWNVYQVVTLEATADTNGVNEAAIFRVSGSNLSDVYFATTTLDDDAGSNLALAAGGATITGVQASNALQAIDGVHTSGVNGAATIWTAAPPGTLTLDLQTTVTLARIWVLNPAWTNRPQRYRIDGSRDGQNWLLVADASQEDHLGWDEWLGGGVARYLRFAGLSNSAESVVRLAEWEVYGTPWSKAAATVQLSDLEQTYDGVPKSATATTTPTGLTVNITYGGLAEPPVAAGSYAVVAAVDDANYEGSATGLLVVAQASQTIDFPNPGTQISTAQVVLAATASSGLPVTYAVAAGPAVLADALLSFTGTGTVSVTASQAGTGNWEPAEPIVRTFEVLSPAPAPPQILFSKAEVLVREDGTDRVYLRLDMAPAEPVVFTVAWSGGDTNIAVSAGGTRIFNAANWDTWQAVVLTAPADENAASETATIRVSAPGWADQYLTARTLDDDLAENLALAMGGTTITGYKASRPEQVIDGIHGTSANYGHTSWTNEPPGTMTLNFNGLATVSQVRLRNWDWTYRVHRYRLESSLNGADWTLLADASGEDRQGWDDWAVSNQPMRYLKFTGLSNSANESVLLCELEVYGERTLVPLPQAVFSKTNIHVREDGSDRVYLRLDMAPLGPVVFTVAWSGGDTNIAVSAGGTRVFNPTNWDTWQAVVLTAPADENAASETATIRVSAAGRDDQYLTVRTLDDDLSENLALAAGGATITGFKASRPDLVIDGVHGTSANYGHTSWTNEPPGYMLLDLQCTASVSRVRLRNWDWTYRVHRYRLESSANGTDWTLLADASGEDHQGWDDWAVSNPALRYVKFTGLSNSANESVVICELEVYETPPVPQVLFSKAEVLVREDGTDRVYLRLDMAPAEPVVFTVAWSDGDTNIAVSAGGTRIFNAANWDTWQAVVLTAPADENAASETATIRVSAAGRDDQYLTVRTLDDDLSENLALAAGGATITGFKASRPDLVIDGVHGTSANYGHTSWTNEPPGYMLLDLQCTASVSRVRLRNWDWTYRVHRYRLESSANGTDWTLLADASGEDHQGWDDWAVSNPALRYVKFTGLSNSANESVLICELEVYGERPAPPPARRAVRPRAAASGAGAVPEPFPLTVVTSTDSPEHTNGWTAVDQDADTAWEGPAGAGGGYIAVGYDALLHMTNLVVELAEGSATNLQILVSREGVVWDAWPEGAEPVAVRYVWLLFADEGAEAPAPRVIEIRPEL